MLYNLRKDLRGKIIAVYGASGNIGSKFVQEATKRGATVIAVARAINKVPIVPKSSDIGSIEVMRADIRVKKEVRKTLRGKNVDVTVNFAANFSKNTLEAEAVNIIGEQYILDASIEYGVKRHIYISTIATQTAKSNPYRDTKLAAEELVKSNTKTIEWIILRYAHVLGTPTWNNPFKWRLPIAQLGVPIVPTDAKKSIFPYVTIETVIDATLAAVTAKPNQTIVVIDGKTTIGEYLTSMENAHGIKRSFLPNELLQFLDKLLGKYIPPIASIAGTAEFLANPPKFENETMKRELQIKTRKFHHWIKSHFAHGIRKQL